MPRVKLGQKQNSAGEVFRYLIAKNKCKENCTTIELAKKIHMPEQTLYHRLKNPEDFRLSEIKLIMKTLNFCESDVEELTRAMSK